MKLKKMLAVLMTLAIALNNAVALPAFAEEVSAETRTNEAIDINTLSDMEEGISMQEEDVQAVGYSEQDELFDSADLFAEDMEIMFSEEEELAEYETLYVDEVTETSGEIWESYPDDLIEEAIDSYGETLFAVDEEEEEEPEIIDLDDNIYVHTDMRMGRSLFAGNLRTATADASGDVTNYYGNQLDSEARYLYDIRYSYYGIEKKTDSLTINFTYDNAFCKQGGCTVGNGFYLNEKNIIMVDRKSDQYRRMMEDASSFSQAAADALLYDHPEIFWTRQASLAITPGKNTVTGEMYIAKMTFNQTQIFPGASGYMAGYAQRVAVVADEIKNTADYNQDHKVTEDELVQRIHDYICEKYQYDYVGYATYKETKDYRIFAPLGLFVPEEMKNGGVCEAYAKSVKVLCDYFGIPCVLVGGKGNPSATDGHMWNYIRHDGKWFLLDTTWDDGNGDAYTHKYYMSGMCPAVSTRVPNGVFSGASGYNNNGYWIEKQVFAYPSLFEEEHSFTDHHEEVTVCTGYQEHVCDADGITYWEKVSETAGHAYDTVEVVPATCLKAGISAGEICSVCGTDTRSILPALGHDYQAKITRAVTCTQNGERLFTCSRCGDHYTEVIKTQGHKYVGVSRVNPSCTVGGYEQGLVCSVCKDDQRKALPALGHNLSSSGRCSRCSLLMVSAPKQMKKPEVVKKKSSKAKVSWKKDKTASGYEIQYAVNKTFKNAVSAYASKKSSSITINKLKKKKTYYFRIRSYKSVDGVVIPGKWSSKIKIKM